MHMPHTWNHIIRNPNAKSSIEKMTQFLRAFVCTHVAIKRLQEMKISFEYVVWWKNVHVEVANTVFYSCQNHSNFFFWFFVFNIEKRVNRVEKESVVMSFFNRFSHLPFYVYLANANTNQSFFHKKNEILTNITTTIRNKTWSTWREIS